MTYFTLGKQIKATHQVVSFIDALKQSVLDQLIVNRGVLNGILLEITAPKTIWPEIKAEIQRQWFECDSFVQLMSKHSMDIRLNDELHLQDTERIHFPFDIDHSTDA